MKNNSNIARRSSSILKKNNYRSEDRLAVENNGTKNNRYNNRQQLSATRDTTGPTLPDLKEIRVKADEDRPE